MMIEPYSAPRTPPPKHDTTTRHPASANRLIVSEVTGIIRLFLAADLETSEQYKLCS